jgi:hypothetical protein
MSFAAFVAGAQWEAFVDRFGHGAGGVLAVS